MNFSALTVFQARVGIACAFLAIGLAARADSSASFPIGGTVRVSVASDGTGPFYYQWKKNGVNIAGANAETYTFANAHLTDSGSYTVSVTNSMGSALSDVALVGVGVNPPAVVSQPISQTVDSGGGAVLAVAVTGDLSPTLQWQRNGVNIAGATGTTLALPAVSSATAGTYTVVVTNFVGSITSAPAIVSIRGTNRLANVSIRVIPGSGAQSLIAGFVTANGNKSILIRAIGPGLAAYTSSPTETNPSLELFYGGNETPFLKNDDWGGTTELRTTFQRLGAFALSNTSKDAAILATLAPKVYTTQVKGNGNGLTIVEIYDADTSSKPEGRIVNLSARTQVGTGDGVLVAGFVIAGTGPKRLLLRAIGPTLSTFGVPNALSDPKLELFVAGNPTPFQSNDDWGGGQALSTSFAQAGAFALTNTTSKDAVLVVTLNPGSYSVVVSGKNNSTGVALVEIYELP
ncbi:MAG: Immunoglobulin I-set domain protein [Verrucomicrobia bacterium]|nr:Immunoglobulin I-set domain protein [Verrucomicrobiota bacterium]